MSNEKDNVSSDYDYSRETYYELIEKGKDALENMIEVARESEHPRAYEVLSGMIKRTIKDANSFSINSITDMQKLKDELKR